MSTTVKTRLRTATVAGLALAALFTGGAAATAAPTAHASAPASVAPDVGTPDEGVGTENVPSIAPDGTQIWSNPTTRAAGPAGPAFSAQGWVEVYGTAGGARIRTTPVTGRVIGTIPYGAYYWVSCKKSASDGFAWGWASQGGRTGWVREDLWDEVQYTGPGGGASPRVPWC